MELNLEYKKKIVAVLSALFPNATIYLFGSRARGTHYERSDIDIALDTGIRLEQVDVGEARDMLNESNIPYKIDVVDVRGVHESMRKNILEEGIVWRKP
jgi:uncharacterized protein